MHDEALVGQGQRALLTVKAVFMPCGVLVVHHTGAFAKTCKDQTKHLWQLPVNLITVVNLILRSSVTLLCQLCLCRCPDVGDNTTYTHTHIHTSSFINMTMFFGCGGKGSALEENPHKHEECANSVLKGHGPPHLGIKHQTFLLEWFVSAVNYSN